MCEKIQELTDISWITVAIMKRTIIMVCDKSYQPNMNE